MASAWIYEAVDVFEDRHLSLPAGEVNSKELFNERGLVLPEFESVRTAAEPIGRVTCIKTGVEIGLLYQSGNGETQAALYEDGLPQSTSCPEQQAEPDLGANRSKLLE
jgi:hypothetical protein